MGVAGARVQQSLWGAGTPWMGCKSLFFSSHFDFNFVLKWWNYLQESTTEIINFWFFRFSFSLVCLLRVTLFSLILLSVQTPRRGGGLLQLHVSPAWRGSDEEGGGDTNKKDRQRAVAQSRRKALFGWIKLWQGKTYSEVFLPYIVK